MAKKKVKVVKKNTDAPRFEYGSQFKERTIAVDNFGKMWVIDPHAGTIIKVTLR